VGNGVIDGGKGRQLPPSNNLEKNLLSSFKTVQKLVLSVKFALYFEQIFFN
jgi:hypothetical protein